MKRVFFILLMCVLVLEFSCAYQEKLLIDNCSLSYRDENFGAWDEASGSGVFMGVNNTNKDFGENENAVYDYIYYQAGQGYYNNFGEHDSSGAHPYNQVSYIPVLNIVPGDEELVYIRCDYLVNDMVFFTSNYFRYYYNYPTGDFNVTRDLAPESTVKTGTFDGFRHSYFYYSTGRTSRQIGVDYLFMNNTKIEGDYSEVFASGFFPGTKPYIIGTINLSERRSSRFHIVHYLAENAGLKLFDQLVMLFYINNSDSDYAVYVAPAVEPHPLTLTGVEFSTASDFSVSSKFFIAPGTIVYGRYNVTNPYSVPITYDERFYFNNWMSSSYINSDVSRWSGSWAYYDYVVQPGETLEKTFQFAAADDAEALGAMVGYVRLYTDSSDGGGYVQKWLYLGSDSDEYLYFGRIDPSIELKGGLPHFSTKMELRVLANYYDSSSIRVQDGEYSIRALIYDSSDGGELLYEKDVVLDDIDLPVNIWMDYVLDIPVSDVGISSTGNYFISLYTVPNVGRFAGETVSETNVNVYFRSGDFQYCLEPSCIPKFLFDETHKSYEKVIMAFNPSYSAKNLIINVDSLPVGYSVSFPDYPSGIIPMGAIEQKEIRIIVTADFDPWPTSVINDVFNLISYYEGEGSYSTSVAYDLIIGGEGCVIDNVVWSNSSVYVGAVVTGNADVSGACDGLTASPTIYRRSKINLDDWSSTFVSSQPDGILLTGLSSISFDWESEIINTISFYEEFIFRPVVGGYYGASDVLDVVSGGDPDDSVSVEDLETVEDLGEANDPAGLPSCRVA